MSRVVLAESARSQVSKSDCPGLPVVKPFILSGPCGLVYRLPELRHCRAPLRVAFLRLRLRLRTGLRLASLGRFALDHGDPVAGLLVRDAELLEVCHEVPVAAGLDFGSEFDHRPAELYPWAELALRRHERSEARYHLLFGIRLRGRIWF
jgi:hypothetical protein